MSVVVALKRYFFPLMFMIAFGLFTANSVFSAGAVPWACGTMCVANGGDPRLPIYAQQMRPFYGMPFYPSQQMSFYASPQMPPTFARGVTQMSYYPPHTVYGHSSMPAYYPPVTPYYAPGTTYFNGTGVLSTGVW